MQKLILDDSFSFCCRSRFKFSERFYLRILCCDIMINRLCDLFRRINRENIDCCHVNIEFLFICDNFIEYCRYYNFVDKIIHYSVVIN
jgi:hypothetical protein